MIARVKHALTRLPSTSTVHAPQVPWSQPFLVPVRFSRSRNASSSVTRGSSASVCGRPLMFSVMVTGCGPRAAIVTLAAAAAGKSRAPCNPAMTAALPAARTRNLRRVGLRESIMCGDLQNAEALLYPRDSAR